MPHDRKRISLDDRMWTWLDEYATRLGLASKTAAIRNLILVEQEREIRLSPKKTENERIRNERREDLTTTQAA